MLFDLRPAQTRCIQILARIALNLRLPILPALYFITESLQPHGKFRAIHAGRIVLRLEETAFLQRASLTILTFRHVEDDSVRMKLRSSITINGPGCIVLKGSSNKLSSRLRRMDIANACLRVALQFVQRHTNTLTMRFAHTLITTYERSERNRLRRGECCIPSCTMLRARDPLAVFIFVGSGWLMLDKLFGTLWMLPFTQSCKVLVSDYALQTPFMCKFSLPLAMSLLVAAPVVLLFRNELTRMICAGLTCRQR